jgi:F0F1-type ATP synthase delta subunit
VDIQSAFYRSNPVSRRYSKALGLLSIASKEKIDLGQLGQELESFIALLQEDPTVWSLLTKDVLSVDVKKTFFTALFARKKHSQVVENLTFLLIGYHHLGYLPKIVQEMKRNLEPKVHAYFFWADERSRNFGRVLSEKLSFFWNKEVVLHVKESQNLLKGWVLVWDVFCIDGSLKTFLKKINGELNQSAKS